MTIPDDSPAETQLSYAQGLATTPLLYETIGNAFDRIAAKFPHRTALISRHQKVRLTYQTFQVEVDR
ncbi:MAG: AMP-binding protein, partial [Myxococcota bacterium]